MTIALDIVRRAHRLIGVTSYADPLTATEENDGLIALNALLGSLSSTGFVYAKTLDTISLTAGAATRTVGPTGTTVTERPIRVSAETYISNGSTDEPVDLISQQQYNDIATKTTTGTPDRIFVLYGMPDITLHFYPVPTSGLTLKLWSEKQLSAFPSIQTTVTLPPGYEDALAFILAEAIAPEFNLEASPTIKDKALMGRVMIRNQNAQIPLLKTEASGGFNILTNQ